MLNRSREPDSFSTGVCSRLAVVKARGSGGDLRGPLLHLRHLRRDPRASSPDPAAWNADPPTPLLSIAELGNECTECTEQ